MAGAFTKDTLRSIRGSLGRFLAIAAIVALGTGFYAGLRMTEPNMELSADAYYDGTDLMDLRVVSTMGLTDGDVEAIGQVEGVKAVMGAYEVDVMGTIGDEQYAMRIHSLPDSAAASSTEDGITVASEDGNYLNRLILVDGRWPDKPGECLLSDDRVMNAPTEIGDTVVLTDGSMALEDALSVTEFTVVGYAHSSYYTSSTAMGTTSLGSGTVQQFMYVCDDSFAADLPYTEAFVTVAGASDERSGSDAYQKAVDAVAARIETLAPTRERLRQAQLKADAQQELDEARAEYNDEKAKADSELADARSRLEEAQKTIESGSGSLADAEKQLQDAEAQLQAGQQALDAAWAQAGIRPADAQSSLSALEAGIAQAEQAAESIRQGLYGQGIQPESLGVTISRLEAERLRLQGQLDSLPADSADRAQLQVQIDAMQDRISALAQARDGLAQAQSTIDSLNSQATGLRRLMAQQQAFDQQKAQAQAAVAAGREQIAQGQTQLDQGVTDYNAGVTEFGDASNEADERFADAEAELADAQRDIDDIAMPEWIVMDRTKNHGAVTFASDAERIGNIATVFPFIFFLVAALVALTTMTRMVEEERILIGTFKALGYSKMRIASKYLIYAALASVAGSAIGIAVLSAVLPMVIMEAYAIVYFVPHGMPVLDWPIALEAAGLGVGITLLATWGAAFATLREEPAALMLPKAPKAGRRILLERIRPLWRRLSFSWKVTFRNIFRYKRRLIMTVIGIAGCTALLLTGLGLQDSINDIIDKQYGELTRYNVIVSTEEDMGATDRQTVEAVLSDGDVVSEYTMAAEVNSVVTAPNGNEHQAAVIAPEDPEAFGSLWVMRTREGGQPLTLGSDDVIVTEKLASIMGVGIGDELPVADQDERGNASADTVSFTVTGIMENYLSNYIFVGSQAYKDAYGSAPAYATYFALMSEDEAVRSAFNDAVRPVDGVKTIAYNDETIDAYRSMLRSVNMVVVVLVLAAAALAFIVLYNLTNINIGERAREIATLKVLGFTRREVDLYIYREIIILSVLGGLLGLVLGVFMESFVIQTAEVDQVMFGREIHPTSFIAAFVLTVVFTVAVLLFMRPKLNRINMVESLKSNE